MSKPRLACLTFLLALIAAAMGCAGQGNVHREPIEAAGQRTLPAAGQPAAAVPEAPPPGPGKASDQPAEPEDPVLISKNGWVKPGGGNSYPLEWVLAEEVLARIRAKDELGLNALRLSAKEYAYLVYPEVEGDMKNRDFFFTLNEVHSVQGMTRAIGNHGDDDLELLQVIPTLGVEECSSFRLLNWVELLVHDRVTNQDRTIKVIGGIIIKDGAAKVMNYRD